MTPNNWALKPLEELFRAHVLKFLVTRKLLPPERVQVLHSWKHSGFKVHASDPVPPENRAELEKLAQYILSRNYAIGGAPPSRRLTAWPVREGDSHSVFWFTVQGRL